MHAGHSTNENKYNLSKGNNFKHKTRIPDQNVKKNVGR